MPGYLHQHIWVARLQQGLREAERVSSMRYEVRLKKQLCIDHTHHTQMSELLTDETDAWFPSKIKK